MKSLPKTSTAFKVSLASSWCMLLLCSIQLSLPVQASPETDGQNARPFKLNAEMDERPQLSRQDLLPANKDSSPAAMSPNDQNHDGLNEALAMPEMAPPPAAPGFALQAQESVPQQPQGMMSEYGVDWSSWVSRLADLWYFTLRKMEDRSGYLYHTTGPALIQFTCYPNGQITNICLRRSSGVDSYDQLQIAALLRTKAPPFPAGTQRTSFTLVQGWESHPRRQGEDDYQPGSFTAGVALEKIKKWIYFR